uniref:RNA helicase n=1 Tax=Cryptomonas curvata TaxID=233186 RepID=A0A6T7ZDA9_9CRYP|mmetsp:Transcript_3782/g.8295  ORF Transcript_3782/g.8295 Transcript_3782/m.8295 type:complete len:588 (+) Transcript_3782:1-1764(+)
MISENAEDVDPLDAFMSGMAKKTATSKPKQKIDRFDEDDEDDPAAAYMIALDEKKAAAAALEAKKAQSALLAPVAGAAETAADAEYDSDEEVYALARASDAADRPVIPNLKTFMAELAGMDHSTVQYQPFEKVFYDEDPEIFAMTETEVVQYRRQLDVRVMGDDVPRPIKTFAQCGLGDDLLKDIERHGYTAPTPIQCQALPTALSGRDVLGIAKTGSGKTAAFLLPMLAHILDQPELEEKDGPIGVVLAPTRELCQQTLTEARKFSKACGVAVAGVYGGASKNEQRLDLLRGAEIAVGTPGRLIDMLKTKATNLRRATYLVLDEADRMIDMGFEPQVQAILDAMPAGSMKPEDDLSEVGNTDFRYRQTFMFSATMPPAVERITRKYLRRPAYVTIGEAGQTATSVTQNFVFCSETQKKDRLYELLRREKPPIMVFVNARKSADVLYKDVARQGFKATVLHGGKTQDGREQALDDFKDGVYDILVCTDVAGRGIDISGVEHVINFDCPKNIEDYTHRIGRTGRAGKTGIATTMLTSDDTHIYYDLKEKLTDQDQAVPREILAHPASREKPGAVPAKAPRTTIQYLRD